MSTIYGTNSGEHIDGTGGNDKIYGKGGNDGIGGHGGNDLIDGGSGNDHIHGGEDHDTLIGGKGADSFLFRSFEKADSDVIKDFNHSADTIWLDITVFLALDGGKLSSGEFYMGAKAHDANDHIIYNKDTGKVFYDDDGKGGHGQHLIFTLSNHANLHADDFVTLSF